MGSFRLVAGNRHLHRYYNFAGRAVETVPKSLISSRIAFAVSSQVDSRTILDGAGPVFEQVDDALADLVAGRVGLVFGLDSSP